ncbi:MAG: IS256 family transposase, partial [Planctomycetota bacterium]
KAATSKQLKELVERPLGDFGLVALMIDGIEFKDVILVVALRIAADGPKHVLGLWPGAAENSRLCKDLLAT